MSLEFLHAMVRVGDLPAAIKFFCEGLGLVEIRRNARKASLEEISW